MIFKQFFHKTSCTYTYLIADKKGAEACLIDPVLDDTHKYLKIIKNLDLKLLKVIDTHIHADHISGNYILKNKTDCEIIMGKSESSAEIASIQVKDRELVSIGKLKLETFFTPGHTNDSYSFKMKDRVFTGDALLISGTGRTDLQGGDPSKSYYSIFNILLKFKGSTLIYPAHDYKGKKFSTIEIEKKTNPRLQVKSKKEYIDIMNNLKLPNPKLMDIAVPINKNFNLLLDKNSKYPSELKRKLNNIKII